MSRVLLGVIALVSTVFLSSVVNADVISDLNDMPNSLRYEIEKVEMSNWLENAAETLHGDRNLDGYFSYADESIGSIYDQCRYDIDNDDLNGIALEDFFYNYRKVSKWVGQKKKTVAYVMYFMWSVYDDLHNLDSCDYLAGAYVIDLDGKDITDEISQSSIRFLEYEYVYETRD